ncbi:MAG: LysR family transcriptional regulator [Bifidobacteriaceae bacterium]|jgi:LysR family nitrogen assimilation transcriptional regulator|nr:LysR family transcriptional regulator [Bifidobacteriaceae bacterium]
MTVVDGKSLEYFVAVSKSGSTRKAAQHLFITQQGLSRAICRLEQHFKLRLFERTSTGVDLTPAGELLFNQSTEILARLENLEREMRAFSETNRETLRLGIAAPLIAEKGAPLSFQALESYAGAHSEIDFSYVERCDDDATKLLQAEQIDLACVSAYGLDAGYVRIPLASAGSTVIVSTDNSLANQPEITLADLCSQTVIVPPDNHSVSAQFELWFDRSDARPSRLAKMSTSFSTALSAVYRNHGVIVVPANSALEIDEQRAKLIPVAAADDYLWTAHFVYRADHPQRHLIEACVAYLRAWPDPAP